MALSGCRSELAGPTAPVVRLSPPQLADTARLKTLGEEQRKSAVGFTVFDDFQFTDRLRESGITYRNRVVSDAAKTYKSAHYDHGTGMAVADVDGDGRLDVYFVSQVGGNSLWRNVGGGRFEDITREAGVALADRVSVTASFADIDNDGDPDLYVTSVRHGNALFENDGRGRFKDVTDASGLAHIGHSSGAVFFDFNRDGRLDLFLTNVGRYTSDTVAGDGYKFYVALEDAFQGHLKPERSEQSRLYRNEGRNRFVDVSAEMGLRHVSWSGDASPVDANGDGWPDLYVLNMQGDDEYYENDGGKRFVRRSREVFPRTSWGAMGIKVFDFDNDGRMDIFITDMHSDMSQQVGPEHERDKSHMMWPEEVRGDGSTSIWGNSVFHNEGRGRFREVSDAINFEMYWPWGLSAGDLNADGFEDVFITAGMNYPYRYATNSLKLNDRGQRFVDAEFVLGVEPRRDDQVATPWFDLDMAGADKGHPEGAGIDGAVSIWGARGSRSSAIFDVDGDGDLDIVTNEFNAEPMVLLSNLSEKRRVRLVSIVLRGTRSNRSGLGAVVTVTAGGASHTQVQDGKSGYLSQSLMPLFFGLGDAERVDRVEVVWPSGRRQVQQMPVVVNGTLTLQEP
jgi:enediyne biosynthesis protein E4